MQLKDGDPLIAKITKIYANLDFQLFQSSCIQTLLCAELAGFISKTDEQVKYCLFKFHFPYSFFLHCAFCQNAQFLST